MIEISQSGWLVARVVSGIDRQPLKKLDADENALLRLLHRWRDEAEGRGVRIERIVVAFEAGRDGFWLARWLRSQGIEAILSEVYGPAERVPFRAIARQNVLQSF